MASIADNIARLAVKLLVKSRKQLIMLVACCLFLSISPALAEDNVMIAMGPSYAVQAGLYVGPIQSNRMAEQLINAGYAAWVEERPQGQGKMLYFVLVGPFSDQTQANEAVRTIAGKFDIEPFIVDLNQR